MYAPPAAAPAPALPLARLLGHTADAVQAVRAGESLNEALARCPPAARPGTQALAFQVLRRLGSAQATRARLAPKAPPPAVDALLLSALALLWPAEDAPYAEHTLVDQAVAAMKQRAPQSAAFANAVLRRFLREREALVAAALAEPVARWNHPLWWIERLRRDWPEQWEAILEADNLRAPMTLRVNARRGSAAAYVERLGAHGIGAHALGGQAPDGAMDPRLRGDDTPGGDTSADDTPGGDTSAGDIPGGDIPGEDVSGEDIPASDIPGEDTSGGDIPGEDTSGGDISGEDTSGGDISGGDVSGKDTSASDISGEDISEEDTSAEDIPAEDIPGNDVSAEGDIRVRDYNSRLHGDDFLAGAVCLDKPCPVTQLPGFAEGEVSVQDAAAQLAAPLLVAGLHPGARILDACAAPGGKTAHLLELGDFDVLAIDRDAARLARVDETLTRLGLHATTLAADAAEPGRWWDGRPFDAILLDAPCSASGIVRRHPDVRWLRRATDIEALAATQARLLDALWPLLAPGGRLLYCTCSVFKAEGRAQIDAFLQRAGGATLAASPPSPGHLLPLADNRAMARAPGFSAAPDGFFHALIEKPRA